MFLGLACSGYILLPLSKKIDLFRKILKTRAPDYLSGYFLIFRNMFYFLVGPVYQ